MVKIFMRRGRNSSGGLRGVVGIEESLHAAYRVWGIVGRCLCPGDCIRRDSAPRTQPALAARLDTPTRDRWFDPSAVQRVTCNNPARPDLCHFGNSGAYILNWPGVKTLDLSIYKKLADPGTG